MFFLCASFNHKKMEKHNLPLVMIVGSMMHEIFRVLKKRTIEQEKINLAIEQFGLLNAISMNEGDVIQKDMANIMGKDKSSILRMIDSLEKKELIRRVVDNSDRRKNYLMVTKKGERVLQQQLELQSVLIKELQQGLTSSDMNTFYKIVNHIISNAEKL